jgi:hypothetical protein
MKVPMCASIVLAFALVVCDGVRVPVDRVLLGNLR